MDARRSNRSLASIVTIAVGGLVAVAAIGGGIALATGLEGDRFPIRWLDGTPFTSYLAPGVILAVVVGGSSAAAAVMATVRSRWAPAGAMVAGLILVVWIGGEVVMLPSAARSVSELVFVAAGTILAIAGAATARRV